MKRHPSYINQIWNKARSGTFSDVAEMNSIIVENAVTSVELNKRLNFAWGPPTMLNAALTQRPLCPEILQCLFSHGMDIRSFQKCGKYPDPMQCALKHAKGDVDLAMSMIFILLDNGLKPPRTVKPELEEFVREIQVEQQFMVQAIKKSLPDWGDSLIGELVAFVEYGFLESCLPRKKGKKRKLFRDAFERRKKARIVETEQKIYDLKKDFGFQFLDEENEEMQKKMIKTAKTCLLKLRDRKKYFASLVGE